MVSDVLSMSFSWVDFIHAIDPTEMLRWFVMSKIDLLGRFAYESIEGLACSLPVRAWRGLV